MQVGCCVLKMLLMMLIALVGLFMHLVRMRWGKMHLCGICSCTKKGADLVEHIHLLTHSVLLHLGASSKVPQKKRLKLTLLGKGVAVMFRNYNTSPLNSVVLCYAEYTLIALFA